MSKDNKCRVLYTLNEYNGAAALYELNTYKKNRHAHYFWFSWKLVLFLASYRNSFLLIRKLNLLRRKYKRRYAATLEYNERLRKSSLGSIADFGPELDSDRDSDLRADIDIEEVPDSTEVGAIPIQYGKVPLSTSVYLLIDDPVLTDTTQRSTTASDLDGLFPIVDRIHTISDLTKVNLYAHEDFSLSTYVHHLRIIHKYRLSLLRQILKRRTCFFRENTLRDHIPSKFHPEYTYMVQYFFNLCIDSQLSEAQELRQNFYGERSTPYSNDVWKKLWRVFGYNKRARFRQTFAANRLSVTVPAIYMICVTLFEREYDDNKEPLYTAAQALRLEQALVQFVTNAVAAFYGCNMDGLKRLGAGLTGITKRIGYSNNFLLERRLASFLSAVCIVPFSDIEILLDNGCVTIGGTTNRGLGVRDIVSNYEYYWITISDSVFKKLSPSTKSDILMRYQYYNNAYWYLWVFFLKSWNLVVREPRRDFLSYLYTELFKQCRSFFKKSRFLNIPNQSLISCFQNRSYTYFITWPSKSPIVYRNIHFMRFWSSVPFNLYIRNEFLDLDDGSSKCLYWTASKSWVRTSIYSTSLVSWNDLSFQCVVQRNISSIARFRFTIITCYHTLSRWCLLKFHKLQYMLSFLFFSLPIRHRKKHSYRSRVRYSLGFDYMIKYLLYYGSVRYRIYKAVFLLQRWVSVRSVFALFNKFIKKGFDLLNTFLLIIPKYITQFFFNALKVHNSNSLIWRDSSRSCASVLRLKILLFNYKPSLLSNTLTFFFDTDLARIWSSRWYHTWSEIGPHASVIP